MTPLPTNRKGISPSAPTLPWPERPAAVTGRPSGIRSPSRRRSRRGYLLRARERGRAWDAGAARGFGGEQRRSVLGRWRITASPDSPCRSLFPKRSLTSRGVCTRARPMCGLGNGSFTSELRLYGTHTLSSLQALLCKPTHGLCGAALPADCVGGTEPQALSVSIAHVKSRVGCDEPPTIPGTIARRKRARGSFRGPPWLGCLHVKVFLFTVPKCLPLKTD